ncbi:MAG: hypothetical protein AAF939_06450 [Planctomycetota bacterium]
MDDIMIFRGRKPYSQRRLKMTARCSLKCQYVKLGCQSSSQVFLDEIPQFAEVIGNDIRRARQYELLSQQQWSFDQETREISYTIAAE